MTEISRSTNLQSESLSSQSFSLYYRWSLCQLCFDLPRNIRRVTRLVLSVLVHFGLDMRCGSPWIQVNRERLKCVPKRPCRPNLIKLELSASASEKKTPNCDGSSTIRRKLAPQSPVNPYQVRQVRLRLLW